MTSSITFKMADGLTHVCQRKLFSFFFRQKICCVHCAVFNISRINFTDTFKYSKGLKRFILARAVFADVFIKVFRKDNIYLALRKHINKHYSHDKHSEQLTTFNSVYFVCVNPLLEMR